MPAKVVVRPKTRPQLQTGTLVEGDPVMGRMLSDLATAQQSASSAARDRNVVVQDLIVGNNKINHGLGRPVRGMTLTPSVADATFSWCLASSDSKTTTVTLIGVDQPRCAMEFY